MPKLRRHRKDHRARAPKRRKRRNLVKFIPEADSDFAFTANSFVFRLKRFPQDYGLSAEQIAEIAATVAEFRAALHQLQLARIGGQQSPQLRMRKDAARTKAERCVRTFGNIIRANPDVSDTSKALLRLKLRREKPKKQECPQAPPTLQFLGTGDGEAGDLTPGSGSGIHVIRFLDASNGGLTLKKSDTKLTTRRAKPDGAVRVELFCDMIPPGERVPRVPTERGWPKYLRSFTRSPMEVKFPIPSEPMLIVYWAKWADSTGETSRWSRPCVARLEGWTSQPLLPDGQPVRRVEPKCVFIQSPIAGELPDGLESDAAGAQIAALGMKMLEAAVSRQLKAES
jgi:hypothetical protein